MPGGGLASDDFCFLRGGRVQPRAMGTPPGKDWRTRAVAGLALLHIAAVVIGAFPVLVDERGMDWEQWQDPLVLGEFDAWRGRLGKVGVEVSRERLMRRAWHATKGYNQVIDAGRAPFRPYYTWCGTRQRWRMFPAPLIDPLRLEIDVREPEAGWRPVYVTGDPEHGWMGRWLDHDRMRAALNLYGWNQYPDAYDDWVNWLSEAGRAAFPEADMLRVRYRVLEGKSPAEMRAAPGLEGGTFRQERVARLR